MSAPQVLNHPVSEPVVTVPVTIPPMLTVPLVLTVTAFNTPVEVVVPKVRVTEAFVAVPVFKPPVCALTEHGLIVIVEPMG